MSFKPITIRRARADIRPFMRSYNDLAKGLRSLRKLIEAELKLQQQRKLKVKELKAEEDEAEDLFK